MTEIVWSETALKTYLNIIDYLFIEWTQKEIITFETEVDTLLGHITSNNYLCKPSKISPYRKCIINKHTTLIYTVKNNVVYLITFLHNKSNHSY
ncbi:MAG: type II toxin-antitoxin system RelE/ParE family toxin [Chitinophagales bacterium]